MQRAHVAAEPRERVAATPEGYEVVYRPPDGLRPQGRAGLWRYPSSPLKLTSRPLRERHQYARSFSYISFYHICTVK